ncbi:MAG TPA: hypothetical protein PK747_04305 [Acidobacteriota bacterium]|nr:hypothetical protein [Acidobacteriota bacterium]HQQ46615.1 hypothetical protein [Acidobacteriota bacterium]
MIGVFGSKKTRNAPQRRQARHIISSPNNYNESRTAQPEFFHSHDLIGTSSPPPFPKSKKSLLVLGSEWLFQEMGRLFRRKVRTVSLEACDIPENASAVTLEALALSFYTCDESISIWDALQTYVAVAKNPAALPEKTLAVSKNGLAILFQDLPVPLQIAVKNAIIKIIKDIYRFKPLMRRPPPR